MSADITAQADPGRYSLQALGRAITILESIATARTPVGVSALARRTAIPKSTTHRILDTLAAQEFVLRTRDGFVVGPRMRRLAQLVSHRTADNLGQLLLPYLVELYDRTGDVVALGVLEGSEMVLVQTIHAPRHESLMWTEGPTPAHCSAIGRVLLAYRGDLGSSVPDTPLVSCGDGGDIDRTALAAELRSVRQQGFAVYRHRTPVDVTEVAMPILGADGPVAALARVRPTPPSFDPSSTVLHRQVAVAASTALRRRIPTPRQP